MRTRHATALGWQAPLDWDQPKADNTQNADCRRIPELQAASESLPASDSPKAVSESVRAWRRHTTRRRP